MRVIKTDIVVDIYAVGALRDFKCHGAQSPTLEVINSVESILFCSL